MSAVDISDQSAFIQKFLDARNGSITNPLQRANADLGTLKALLSLIQIGEDSPEDIVEHMNRVIKGA